MKNLSTNFFSSSTLHVPFLPTHKKLICQRTKVPHQVHCHIHQQGSWVLPVLATNAVSSHTGSETWFVRGTKVMVQRANVACMSRKAKTHKIVSHVLSVRYLCLRLLQTPNIFPMSWNKSPTFVSAHNCDLHCLHQPLENRTAVLHRVLPRELRKGTAPGNCFGVLPWAVPGVVHWSGASQKLGQNTSPPKTSCNLRYFGDRDSLGHTLGGIAGTRTSRGNPQQCHQQQSPVSIPLALRVSPVRMQVCTGCLVCFLGVSHLCRKNVHR